MTFRRSPELGVVGRTAAAITVLAAVLLVFQSWRSVGRWSTQSADLHAYRIAAERIAKGEDPYLDAADGAPRYLYPPTFVLAAAPMLRMRSQADLARWAGLQLGALALLAVTLWRSSMHLPGDREHLWLAAVVILFGPAWRNLVEGQVSAVVVAAMFAGALLLERRTALAGAILLAFASLVKVLPAIAVVILAAQRRIAPLVWVGMAAGVLATMPFPWAWPSAEHPGGYASLAALWWSWLQNMVAPVATDAGSWVVREYTPWNHSFVAVLHRLFDPLVRADYGPGVALMDLPRSSLRMAAWAVGASGVTLSCVVASRGRHIPHVRVASFGFALVMVNLLHAQTWTHHLLAFSLCLPLLATRSAGTVQVRTISSIAIGVFGAVFSAPGLMALALPTTPGWLHDWSWEAGKIGLPTLAVVGLWTVLFRIARNEADGRPAPSSTDGPSPGSPRHTPS